MKTIKAGILTILMLGAFFTCSAQTNDKVNGKLEIYYAHFNKRCATCNAVENETKALLKKLYGSQMEKGEITFKSLNLDEKADKKFAKKLNISGQALMLIKGEKQINLTSEGFLNARNNPEKFHKVLKKNIDDLI
jgi:hypothetical protein